MVKSNANALGIIFPNSYDSLVPELVGERLMNKMQHYTTLATQ